MIRTTLNDQNPILENCIGRVIIFLFWLKSHSFTWRGRGFVICSAAGHQGAIKEPAASLLRMRETHPVSLRLESAHLSVRFKKKKIWARGCKTFTLHDLTDFYVEMVTAHRIKINYHFLAKLKNKTKIKTYLGARGPPGVSGALRSLCILR